jgi:hypothetical protein
MSIECANKYIKNRLGERGIKTKARIKVAAKMLTIAWTMLKNKEPFDQERLSERSAQQR